MLKRIYHEYKEKSSSKQFCQKKISSNKYDIVIHIGAPKTGSSALQSFLLDNRNSLIDFGYYYPEHGLDKNRVSGGHSIIGINLIEGDYKAAEQKVDEWVIEAKKDNACLLLSAESLYSKPKMLKKIVENYKVAIVAYFRDPVELLISNYNQLVKRHYATLTLKDFARNECCNDNLDGPSGKVLAIWLECFGHDNVVVMPYGKKYFRDGKIECSFLDFLGVEKRNIKLFKLYDKAINVSYTRSALEFKRLVNHVLDREDIKYGNRIDWCLQSYSDKSNEEAVNPIELLGSKVYSELIDKFSVSNQYLLNNFFKDNLDFFLKNTDEYRSVPFDYVNQVSLYSVVVEAFEKDEDLVVFIRNKVVDIILKGQAGFSVLKLADLLGVDVPENTSIKSFFNKNQKIVIHSDKAKVPDFLREISISLERLGEYEDAYSVICKAQEMRKQGSGILNIKKRLEIKLIESK